MIPEHIKTTKFFILYLILFPSFTYASTQEIYIGSKADTETQVLAEIVKLNLINNGFVSKHKANLGGTLIPWQALQNNSIQIIPEYIGTIKEQLLHMKGPRSRQEISEALRARGIEMTDSLGFENGYGLAVTRQTAKSLGIKKISDLRNDKLEISFAMTHEFIRREDGWEALKSFYELPSYPVRGFEHQLGYKALLSNKAQVKDVYTTDAIIRSENLLVLDDDQDFFPDYSSVLLFRTSLPANVKDLLRNLEGKIELNKVRHLNQIAENLKSPEAAAKHFWGDTKNSKVNLKEHVFHLINLIGEHLILVGSSMILALILGFPLGILVSLGGRFSTIILAICGVLQTIPSLAILALMIPIFGISKWTAIVALLICSILPIVRSTSVGLSSIPEQYKISGKALGMPRFTLLHKVYIPIALPNILTGIKTSAIWNIGTATLAALIGAGGLGEPIISGITLNDFNSILFGAIPVSLLAILTEIAFRFLDKKLIHPG